MDTAKILFWFFVAVVMYAYVGYPILIACISRGKRRCAADKSEADLPQLTIIIPAHNEERWIGRKVENVLELDYPRDRVQVLVVSDGSTDGTVEMAQRHASKQLQVLHFQERAGKTAALNRAIPWARGDILVFTDANALLDHDALKWLIPHFANPEVGGVAGNRTCLPSGSPSTEGEGMYWRYEAWIKSSESRFHSCLGAYGQVFAVRRRLYPYVPAVSDDFSIPMKIVIDTGSRIIFEPHVLARIPAAMTLRQEWERKIRSHVAVLYDIAHLKRGLIPLHSPIWWQFWSHHVLRLLVPLAMIAALMVSPWLWAGGKIFRAVVSLEGLFYLAAAIGMILVLSRVPKNRFYACFYFVFANAAIIVSWARWLARRDAYTWRRTERVLPAGN